MWRRIVNVAAGACLAVGAILQWLGLRKRRDPWRAAAGINLRVESAKFTLTAFGLGGGKHAPVDFAVKLREFLAGEKLMYVAVENRRSCTKAVPLRCVDITLAEYAETGELLEIEPVLDPKNAPEIDAAGRGKVHRALLRAINSTQLVPVLERPDEILRIVGSGCDERNAVVYAKRLLQGAFLAFDRNGDRFAPPDPAIFRHPGTGLLNFTVRSQADGSTDLWMQVHHMPVDGAPMQELLDRLRARFGVVGEVRFPAPGETRKTNGPRLRGERDLVIETGSFDFTGLLELRKKLNEKYRGVLSEGVAIGALLAWRLAHQCGFEGINFAIVADVPKGVADPRGVDFVVIRPGEYFRGGSEDAGFVVYANEFSRRLALVRARQSRTIRTMKKTALLPAGIAFLGTKLNAGVRERVFGTCGITILKSAEIFLAPMARIGFERGFLAIGNMRLPSQDGGHVGEVSIKGEANAIAGYLDALRKALIAE